MTGRSLWGRLVVALVVSLATCTWAPQRADAQEKPEAKPAPAPSPKENQGHTVKMYPDGWVTKVFQLKNTEVDGVYQALTMFSGTANANRSMRLVMWTGPKDLAPTVEDTVRKLDVAPQTVPNVELTFYLLVSSKQAGEGGTLPADLDGVAKQVKGIFGLANLSLLETAAIRTRDGSEGSRTEGVIRSSVQASQPTFYTIEFGRVAVSADERGKVVRLGRLDLRLRVPIVTKAGDGKIDSVNYNSLSLRTDIDIREGQKVVVGKATVDGSGGTLFLVATAKVVD
jgi:hypothetical protein